VPLNESRRRHAGSAARCTSLCRFQADRVIPTACWAAAHPTAVGALAAPPQEKGWRFPPDLTALQERGDGPWKDLSGKVHPPTGKSFELEFCTVARWSEIVEEKLFYDQVSFLRQIGLL
jgi:hypothetical protein